MSLRGFFEALVHWPIVCVEEMRGASMADRSGPVRVLLQIRNISSFISFLLTQQEAIEGWVEERGRTSDRSEGSADRAKDRDRFIKKFGPRFRADDLELADTEVWAALTTAIDAAATTAPFMRVEETDDAVPPTSADAAQALTAWLQGGVKRRGGPA